MLHVAEGTAQIYTIDSFAEEAPIDHVQLVNLLQVTEENFEAIRNCIEQNKDHKLRSIRDKLVVFSYNQIRFVVACMIRGFDPVNSFTYQKTNREIHKTISITETAILCL